MQYPIEVPALDHDGMMAARFPDRYGSALRYRQRVERFILAALCAHLKDAGFDVVKVDDGEEMTNVVGAKQAMELAFGVDDCRVYFRKPGYGPHPVVFIWDNGEDGITCISDWGYSDNDPDGFNAAMDAFDAEKALELQRDRRPL